MIKILTGLLLCAIVMYVVDCFLVPLPHTSSEYLTLGSISQLMLRFEASVAVILLAGFVFQELLHHYDVLFRRKTQPGLAAHWKDLVYVVIAVFGSGVLYASFVKAFGRI